MPSYWSWRQVEHVVADTLENAEHEKLKSSFLHPCLWAEYIYPSYRLKNSRLAVFISCLDEITTNKTDKPNKEPVNTEIIDV